MRVLTKIPLEVHIRVFARGSLSFKRLKNTNIHASSSQLWTTHVVVDETRQICVQNTATDASTCLGDSGGAMLSKKNNQWLVSGVTSFGSGSNCNTDNEKPNVYTRVAHYLSWMSYKIDL